ncbi:MAG TPA: DNA-processing protein DprA [Hyphomicrobiaceae bacterium]|nr:DNA-processing protein DprA [Hyphomicrobiaceae bacterium]
MERGRDRPAAPAPAAAAASAPAPLTPAQRIACLRLIRSENVGPVTYRELVAHFGDAGTALDALPELSRRGGYRHPIRICPRDVAEAELEAADRIGARPLIVGEPGYPEALAAIDPPPPLLYVRGNPGLLVRPMLAIVGARNGSAAGQKLARQFAARLGSAGLVIVSGLARGIDAAAHESALATGTVAVLAGGPDNVYPPEHADLQRRIIERGCLVTESPPGFAPRAQDFPRRNRIISGLALGVLIVEAARRSGTLVTARMAGEQGREVFAIPGHPLDPRAEGTNGLIKAGATLVTELDDVLGALAPLLREPLVGVRPTASAPAGADTAPPLPAQRPGPPAAGTVQPPLPGLLASDRDRLLDALGPAPVAVDELTRATGLPSRTIQIALLELALAGRIERHGHHLVSLKG